MSGAGGRLNFNRNDWRRIAQALEFVLDSIEHPVDGWPRGEAPAVRRTLEKVQHKLLTRRKPANNNGAQSFSRVD